MLSVLWEAKARHSSSSKRFCETPKTMKGVLGFCETLSQFPVCLENSHSSCISDIDSAEITLDSGTWNVSESVEAEVVFALPGWFSRFAVGRACRAGPWNEAEREFEGVQDVFQACSDSSSAAAAIKRVGSGSKVSEKDSGEMKENEKEPRGQFFVKHGSTTSVVRSSSLDVVSDILQLHSDEYAVCGSRLIKMDSTLSQNGIGEWFECASVATAAWWCRCVFGHSWSVGVQSVSCNEVFACKETLLQV